MGIDLSSQDTIYADLVKHRKHKIVCIDYGGMDGSIWSMSLECETCGEVLLDADAPGVTTESKTQIKTKDIPWKKLDLKKRKRR